MSHAIKHVHYEVSLFQYIRYTEEYPGKEERFHTEWNNNSCTLLAITGEEDVALLCAENLARKLDEDRTLAVWSHGNTFNITVRVTKMVSGSVPVMVLRLSSYKDNPIGELVRTDPTKPNDPFDPSDPSSWELPSF
jgi:hypothetical protein